MRLHITIRKLWTWRASGREIEAEFRAQIGWMRDRGVVPEHADSHHHMHLYPRRFCHLSARSMPKEFPALAPRDRAFGPRENQLEARTKVP